LALAHVNSRSNLVIFFNVDSTSMRSITKRIFSAFPGRGVPPLWQPVTSFLAWVGMRLGGAHGSGRAATGVSGARVSVAIVAAGAEWCILGAVSSSSSLGTSFRQIAHKGTLSLETSRDRSEITLLFGFPRRTKRERAATGVRAFTGPTRD
jgi:hypothetical protein